MFQRDGTITTGSKYRPPKWEEWPRAGVYHHLIPYQVLRDLWNRMTQIGMTDHRSVYLQQVTQAVPAGNPLPIDEYFNASAKNIANKNRFDYLETAVVWQAFNMAVGPKHRPALPDPPQGEFDHVSVIPAHVQRVYRLREVSRQMGDFLAASEGGRVSPNADQKLGDTLEGLGDLTHMGIITPQDVNWYGVTRRMWIQMSAKDRQTFDAYMNQSGMVTLDKEHSERQETQQYAQAALEFLVQDGQIVAPPGFSDSES
ncbi:hypothetical protein Enr13x_35930 [Stieleria neptunia]|uniref:Uncharacterized protein n=1 Tax=Stieleria neptunia TaxID=2527979 RepID=A0A518HSC0_9BACT|nr:hypothetical protein [Stieleria neptunia]QDV43735.1 hypothetical protein Enr13x_35930 [Stieleria neptunia]